MSEHWAHTSNAKCIEQTQKTKGRNSRIVLRLLGCAKMLCTLQRGEHCTSYVCLLGTAYGSCVWFLAFRVHASETRHCDPLASGSASLGGSSCTARVGRLLPPTATTSCAQHSESRTDDSMGDILPRCGTMQQGLAAHKHVSNTGHAAHGAVFVGGAAPHTISFVLRRWQG